MTLHRQRKAPSLQDPGHTGSGFAGAAHDRLMRRTLSAAQSFDHSFQRHHQHEAVSGRAAEAEFLIKSGRILIEGVNQKSAQTDGVSGSHGFEQGVPDERGPKSFALEASVDSEACHDHNRDRGGHVASYSAGGLGGDYAPAARA